MQRKFSSTILTPNRERVPNHIGRWFIKPREFEGAGAVIARPGTIVPKVHRDAKVVCKVIYVSDTYFDSNGRPRKDVAFELCRGPIDGVIRIEAGEDRIPIFNYLGIDDVVAGQQFYKSLEVKTGEFDQTQSAIIESRVGDADTPHFPGLAYFVLKGFKLWKWPNRSIPYMEAVVLRNIEEASNDEYAEDPILYNPPAVYPVTSITGGITGEDDILYVTYSGGNVWKVELSTNTWTSLGTAGNTIRSFHGLRVMNDQLYLGTGTGLYRYSGSGTIWDLINGGTTADRAFMLEVNGSNDDEVWWARTVTGGIEVYKYDGTFAVPTGYPGGVGADHKQARNLSWSEFDQTFYFGASATVLDNSFYQYQLDSGSWAQGTDSGAFNGGMVNTKHIRFSAAGVMQYGKYTYTSPFKFQHTEHGWVQEPAAPTQYNVEEVFSDTVSRIHDTEFFSNKYHYTILKGGDKDMLYRREAADTFVKLEVPSSGSITQLNMIQKVNNKLYVGTNRGFFQVSGNIIP